MAHSMHPVHSPRQLLWSNKNWTATLIKQRRLKLFRHVAWADQSEDNSRASLHCDHQTRQWRTQTSEPWSALSLPTNAWSSIMAQDRGNSYAHGVSVPHDDDDDDDNSVQRSFTWLTVVPMQPCSTICSILGCGGSCLRATASSFVFFCMSSIATSIGVSTTCSQSNHNEQNAINVNNSFQSSTNSVFSNVWCQISNLQTAAFEISA